MKQLVRQETKVGTITAYRYVERECPEIPECAPSLPATGAPEPTPLRPTSILDCLARSGAFQQPCGPAVGRPFGTVADPTKLPLCKRIWGLLCMLCGK
jgi:hypothetical protein